jgi:hypothetical protein
MPPSINFHIFLLRGGGIEMIRYICGDIFGGGGYDVLVVPVNMFGVMGKGMARASKRLFPDNYMEYYWGCKRGEVRTGRVFVVDRGEGVEGPRWIVNFPTKRGWWNESKEEWIRSGLRDLRVVLLRMGRVMVVRVPALGCGEGKLRWEAVRRMIDEGLEGMGEDVTVEVFEPLEVRR